MTDAVDDAFEALRREYLTSLPARLDELRSDVAALRSGQPEAGTALKIRLHRLAGSGGSYGFAQMSSLARQAERWLATNASSQNAEPLEAILNQLAFAVSDAEREMKKRG